MCKNKNTERIIANVKATLALEKLEPSDEVIEIIRKHLNGSISENKALEMINNFISQKYLSK